MVAGQFKRDLPSALARIAARKVPELTVAFWVTKVLITGASVWWPDYLYGHFGVVIVSGVLGAVLVAALALQLRARRYNAWIYWLAFGAASVAGTEAANGLHTELGFPYIIAAEFCLVVLAMILVIWRASEKTLSLGNICTRRQELYYWAAVLAAFALGGAVDHATAVFQLGYQRGYLILFAAVTAITTLAWWRFGLNRVFSFWLAFVVTRPLGAALADWMAAGHRAGGLGMGRWPVSLGLAIAVVGLVEYMAVTSGDVTQRAAVT
jgi:uncharacterized membrane-anchored protein